MRVKDLQFLVDGFNKDYELFLQAPKEKLHQSNQLESVELAGSELINFVRTLGIDKERRLTIKELYDLSEIILKISSFKELGNEFISSVTGHFPIKLTMLETIQTLGILSPAVLDLSIKNMSDAEKSLRLLHSLLEPGKIASQTSLESSEWYFNSMLKNKSIISQLAKMVFLLLSRGEFENQLHPDILKKICAIAASSITTKEYMLWHKRILSEYGKTKTVEQDQLLINQCYSSITRLANRAEGLNGTVEILRLDRIPELKGYNISKRFGRVLKDFLVGEEPILIETNIPDPKETDAPNKSKEKDLKRSPILTPIQSAPILTKDSEEKKINRDDGSTDLATEIKASSQAEDHHSNFEGSSTFWSSRATSSINLDSEDPRASSKNVQSTTPYKNE